MKPIALKIIIFTSIAIWLLTAGNFVKAQSVEDSLLTVINTSTDDSVIVHSYIILCDLKTYNDTQKAIEYAQTAVEIAQKAKYFNGVAKGYERLGNAYFQLGDNRQAANNYLNAREANKKVGNYQIEGSVLYNLGNIQNEMGNYDSSIYYGLEAGKVFIANNDTMGYGASLYLVGSEYRTKGNYDLATQNILEALSIFRRLNNRDWEVYALNALVDVYTVQEKYDESLKLLNTCLSFHQQNNNEKFVAITYRFMGDIYITLDEFDKARNVLDSSFFINDSRGFEQEKLKTMYSQGMLEYETENYDKALTIFNDGLQLSFKLNDELFKCSNYLGIGRCLNKKVRYREAAESLIKSIEHATIIGDHFKLRENYLELSENYEAQNLYDKALDNYKLYAQYNDSITAEENKRQFAELASKYETEKKEQQITDLQLENRTAESNRQRVTTFWLLTIIIAILIVSILVLAYRKNRQLLANEKELDKIKSRFFANISHEFRTPLTLISGPVHDLLQKKEAKPFHKELGMVQKQADRLLMLINQILDLSKLDAGKYRLNIVSADFVAMLKSTVLSFHSLAESKNIQLKIKTDCNKLNINFDRENLETVLNNLLSNAFKFEPEGGRIEVAMNASEVNKIHQLQFEVTNYGSYLAPELGNKLFDRFYQGEQEQKTGNGTGIGLALTKELVELHGGKISLRSSEDEGTTFIVTLPTNLPVTEDSEINEARIHSVQALVTDSSFGGNEDSIAKQGVSVVLIVEDHPEVMNYIESVLQADYQIEKAVNGREGVERANSIIPDVIISDVMMPEMDGIQLTHELKNSELTSHIPIILLTAKASVENRIEGLEAKADDYLTKPFNANELQLRVKNIIDVRNKLREKYSAELVIKPQNLVVKSLDEVFIGKICNDVEENLKNENFSVQDLSKNIGLSRSQLHRKLEALTGKSASQFIREYRLERARELIEKNAGTISEISYQVGFSSPGYFNKCFKEYFKITPGDLRNNTNLQPI